MTGIRRNNNRRFEVLVKNLIFAAIDAGKTFEELGDIKLHGVAVDERRIGAKTKHRESRGDQVGQPRRWPQIARRAR